MKNIFKYYFCSKYYIVSLVIALSIVFISNLEWGIDEYVYKINHYSIFNKLISVRIDSLGSKIFYWLFPLIAGISCVYPFSKCFEDKTKMDIVSKTFAHCLVAFGIGFSVVFISLMADFWMLSMITESFYPLPNDMTTVYNSNKIFSRLFFKHPRIFVLVWSAFESFWSGSFSVLSIGLECLLKRKITSLFSLMLIYIIEYYISFYYSFTPWKKMLCSGEFEDISVQAIVYNCLAIVLLGVIMILTFGGRNSDEGK